MWSYNHTDELFHHGTKGMRWGVRRFQNKDGSLTAIGRRRKSKKDTRSEDAKVADKLRKKKLSEMSNEELKTLNKRAQLEQDYNRLNPSAVKKGLAIAVATAGALGTIVTLHNNGKQAISLGKSVAEKMKNSGLFTAPTRYIRI